MTANAVIAFIRHYPLLFNLSIRAMDCIITCIIIPNTTFTNCFPLRFRSLISYIRKQTAIIERITADTRHTVGNGYACKRTATIERRTADTCYTISYCYTCRTAIIERTIKNISARYSYCFIAFPYDLRANVRRDRRG